MRASRLERLIREFPQNGIKFMLEDPRNTRDMLALAEHEAVNWIDFSRARLVRTTFVARDFRHVEADVVLTAPLHRLQGGQRRLLWLYLLIEHQSQPDLLMPLRILDYVVQIFKAQMRIWSRTHASFAGFRLQPVLPVVLYTGIQRWSSPGTLADLVEMAERFRQFTPIFEPLFVNLPAMTPARLETAGGFFGRVLRLVQQREAQPRAFQHLLEQVVASLEEMPPAERLRWLELLSYIHALVYHERHGSEHARLQETIQASVQSELHQREVATMGQTIAEKLKSEGRREGLKKGLKKGLEKGQRVEAVRVRRETLLRLLQKRYHDLPFAVADAVGKTTDVKQLDTWLDRFAIAQSLTDIGIS